MEWNNNIQVIKKMKTDPQWDSIPRPKDSQASSLTTVPLGQLAVIDLFAVLLNFKKLVLLASLDTLTISFETRSNQNHIERSNLPVVGISYVL